MSSSVEKWLVIARFWSFPTGIVPITVASAFAFKSFNVGLYLLMVIGVVSLNAVANILNDVFDFRHGVDRKDDEAMKKRMHPLVVGTESENKLLAASALLFVLALACGVYIALYRGPLVIVFGIIGALSAFFYTAGKRSIKSIGLGELLIFLVYGPVITCAAYFVESGGFSLSVLAASLPIGIGVALILFANNIRDISADVEAGMSTLAAKLGAKHAKTAFKIFLASVYVLIAVFASVSLLPITALAAFASIFYAFGMSKKILGASGVPYNSAEIVSNFVILLGVLLVIGIVA